MSEPAKAKEKRKRVVVCWHCGNQGHHSDNCPTTDLATKGQGVGENYRKEKAAVATIAAALRDSVFRARWTNALILAMAQAQRQDLRDHTAQHSAERDLTRRLLDEVTH